MVVLVEVVIGKGEDVDELVVTDEVTFCVVRIFLLYRKLWSLCSRGLVRAYPGLKSCARVAAYGLFGCPKLWLSCCLKKECVHLSSLSG